MDLLNITTPYPKHIQQKMDEDFAKLMKEIDDDKKQSAGKRNSLTLKRYSNKNEFDICSRENF
jgi:hypothetical protein